MIQTVSGERKTACALLVLFFIAVYLLPLGFRQMHRPDEFRYAEVPREMIASGDWVTPRLADVRYFEKPALGYQLTAYSFRLFGENPFALRLPSALAAGLAACFLYFFLRKNSDDPHLPFLATAIFLCSGLVYGIGTFAVLDSQLNAALTGSIVLFYCAWRNRTSLSREIFLLLAAGLFMGIAFLLKGFLAFVIPFIVLIPFLLLQKEWTRIVLYGLFSVAVALLFILPWSLEIHKAEPDFWRYFIMEEHWKRFTGETYDRDPQPFWYFLPVLLGGIMPAGLLWFVSWLGWKDYFGKVNEKTRFRRALAWTLTHLRKDPLLTYCFFWFLIPFLFFSTSSCKLGTYILPCFAPLAVLTAYGALGAFRNHRELAVRIWDLVVKCFAVLLLIVGCAGVVFLLLSQVFTLLPRLYEDGSFSVWMTAVFVLLWGGALLFVRDGRFFRIPLFLFGVAPALIFGLHSLPDKPFGDKVPGVGVMKCLKDVPVHPDDIVLVDRNSLHAVAWCLKKTDLILVGRPGELKYGFENYPEYGSRFYQDKDIAKLTATAEKGKIVGIFIRNLKKYPLPKEMNGGKVVTHNGVSIIRF